MHPLVLTILLFGGRGVLAQEPDTRDWKGYFPLEVGNEWEYRLDLTRPAHPYRPTDESRTAYARFRVVADAAGPDRDRFALVEERFSNDSALLKRDTVAVRYDPETASVLALRPRTDGEGTYEIPVPFFACNLDRPTTESEARGCWIGAGPFSGGWTGGEIPPFLRDVDTSTVPEFFNFSDHFAAVHGIGFVAGVKGAEGCSMFCDLDVWALTYADVGGQTYGARAVHVEAPPPVPVPTTPLTVFPNPTRGFLVVHATIHEPADNRGEVYDMAGRRVGSFPMPLDGRATLDLSRLPGGVYLIRVGEQTGKVVVE